MADLSPLHANLIKEAHIVIQMFHFGDPSLFDLRDNYRLDGDVELMRTTFAPDDCSVQFTWRWLDEHGADEYRLLSFCFVYEPVTKEVSDVSLVDDPDDAEAMRWLVWFAAYSSARPWSSLRRRWAD